MLGLVARRQAAVWGHWRPWLILFGFVIPAGLALYAAARWDAGLIGSSSLRFTLVSLRSFATLACWSVMAGAILRTFSRRAIIVQAFALVFVLILSQSLNLMTLLAPARFPSLEDRTDAWLGEVLVPWLVQVLFVPTFLACGMFLRLTRSALFGTAVTVILFLCRPLAHIQLLPAPLMAWVLCWPAAYFAFRLVRRQVHVPAA